ncbi:ABC transporter permease [Leucobacter ruminantium]|uniref:Transport permease protein n=1 Tax=Leucobacter ruminantium TaxID=1289170 RepID=A0A939LVJ8_9MICO|nr:ABC transporter permease [Leucobacter ruminantium]MBO1805555.1 ABC transporter permease [Leucobacter ruminantium]
MNQAERFESLAQQPFSTIGVPADSGKSHASYKGFLSTSREIIQNRSMLALLVRRDIKSRYKDSSLGLIWTLIRPLTQLAIYFVVVGKFLGAERGIPDFAIYIFTGLTAYGLFSEIVSGGTASILGNAGLVKKVYVPRELFPLAATGTALFNFAIQLAILIVIVLVTGKFHISWNLLYLIPSLIVLISFGLALALLFSAWFVYLRDIGYFVEIAVMVLMWASPILYSWQMVHDVVMGIGLPWLLQIYTANPVTLAVLGFQESIWGTAERGLALPENLMTQLCVAAVLGLLCVVGAQRIFARMQGNFAQEL